MESLCSECTSALFPGTYVSIRDADIRLAIKKIKQDTNPAHSCLQPELSIPFQSRKVGVVYVGLKVWPRSFLSRPTSLPWVEVSLTSRRQNSTLQPCPTSPPAKPLLCVHHVGIPPFILTTRSSHLPHFSNGKTEAQRG